MSKQAHRKPLGKKVKEAITMRDGGLCKACVTFPVLEIHHIKAIVDGGTDDLENLAGLCSLCHHLAPDEIKFNAFCQEGGCLKGAMKINFEILIKKLIERGFLTFKVSIEVRDLIYKELLETRREVSRKIIFSTKDNCMIMKDSDL